jgi:alpha-amylase/alpha-mannosidase (GH57 family)
MTAVAAAKGVFGTKKWRRPLRTALDWLRDQLAKVYEEHGKQVFRDPWQARDEYIQVIRDRSPAMSKKFLTRHRSRKLTAAEQVDALRLLEMQRHSLLMYTSCGWFFEELLDPKERRSPLRFACVGTSGRCLRYPARKTIYQAPLPAASNVELFKHGAEVYRQLVVTAQITMGKWRRTMPSVLCLRLIPRNSGFTATMPIS